MASALFRALGHRVLSFVLPNPCLHCRTVLEPRERVLCRVCGELLELTTCEPPSCYPLSGVTAAFTHVGPAASLTNALRRRPQLACGAAGYLAAQLLAYQWPVPDLIIPVPMTRLNAVLRGFNPSALLAHYLARLLSSKSMSLLRNQNPRLPQQELADYERRALPTDTYTLTPKTTLQGNTVLLVDDFHKTGATLRACAHALVPAQPKRIYAITLTGYDG